MISWSVEFSGWCVHGKLTCPICGKDIDCFRLDFGKKICYFDCHIDVFFLQTTPLGSKEMLSERLLLCKRNLRGVEPVRRLLRN
jgi:hypothetical protein